MTDQAPARPTAHSRDGSDQPRDRDQVAADLAAQLEHPYGLERPDLADLVNPDKALDDVAAALLLELSAVYAGEPLGGLALEVATRLEDREPLPDGIQFTPAGQPGLLRGLPLNQNPTAQEPPQ